MWTFPHWLLRWLSAIRETSDANNFSIFILTSKIITLRLQGYWFEIHFSERRFPPQQRLLTTGKNILDASQITLASTKLSLNKWSFCRCLQCSHLITPVLKQQFPSPGTRVVWRKASPLNRSIGGRGHCGCCLIVRLEKISAPNSQFPTALLPPFICTFSNLSLLTPLTSIMRWAGRMCFSTGHVRVSFPSCWSCLLKESRKLLASSVRLLHVGSSL